MANSKFIIVKESEQELKGLLRQLPIHKKNRIQMLIVLKKSEKSLSKIELSNILKINHNTAQKWRKAYFASFLATPRNDKVFGITEGVK